MAGDRIMIVEDEMVLRQSLKIELGDEGFIVEAVESGEAALERMGEFQPHLMLLDLRLPGMDGISVLEAIRKEGREVAVIIMTAHGDTRTTVSAVKSGADNFINKPFELDELWGMIHKALNRQKEQREFEYLKYQKRRFYRYCDLVGQSSGMRAVYEKIDLLALSDSATVLIRGESGTGKELVASAIHYKSRRSDAPLVEINCASLPENLLESELFGHEKGAFTGATELKKGLFELGDGGTIFLDEIGEMPVSLQAKLLRFLEKKQFKRLGSGRDLKVDARIIAATNRDLAQAMEGGTFREDLFYRLNVVSISPPPLRERRSDIPLLASYFLNEFCRDMGKGMLTLSDEVTAVFNAHPWRGNVRELRNTIERAVIFARGSVITPDLLPREMQETNAGAVQSFSRTKEDMKGLSINEILAKVEQEVIDEALRSTGGNKTKAAEELGISRFSLNRRIERLSRAFGEE